MADKTLSNEELFHFCEQYAILLKAGVSSVEGLRILGEEHTEPEGGNLLARLLDHMEMSGSLADTLGESGVFPSSMVSYVRLGEQTGCLDEVMEILAGYYKQELEIASQIRSAVTYPLIMLGMMVAVVAVLLTRVLPVFSQVFSSMGMEMTGISAAMMRLGKSFQRYTPVFTCFLLLLIAAIAFFCLHPKGSVLFRKLVMKLPHFRTIPAAMDYSRLCQGIAMGLHSGLSPQDSMDMALDLVSEPHIHEQLARASAILKEGGNVSSALNSSGLFGGMEARLITIGFQSGSGEDVMQRLASRYALESTSRIDAAIAVLEPTIVIIMSVLVGVVLLTVMLPLLGVLSEMME